METKKKDVKKNEQIKENSVKNKKDKSCSRGLVYEQKSGWFKNLFNDEKIKVKKEKIDVKEKV